MPRRSGWSGLSSSYRSRLVGAGRSGRLTGRAMTEAEVRRYWERGGDLRSGRSHGGRPATAAPLEATEMASGGLLRDRDAKALRRWRERSSPPWIPRNRATMGDDTAAILSQVGIPPARWKSVTIELISGGRYRVTVVPRRGYPRVVVLPDRDSMIEFTSLMRDPRGAARTPAERRRLERAWKGTRIKVNTSGTK